MWFDESYFNAISLDTLDAIGTALKPVAPISGFIFFLVNKLKILTAKIPPKTDKTKAIKPPTIIDKVLKFKKLSLGDEFFVRYVPQSRYFQSQELEISGDSFNQEKLNEINNTKIFYREKSLLNND